MPPTESKEGDTMRGEMRAAGGGRPRGGGRAQAACTGRVRQKADGQGARGAHPKHGVHGRDLDGVEAQRLVEHRGELPSRKEGIRCGARCGPGGERAWGGGGAQAACTRKGTAEGCVGARACAERTQNMKLISVTSDVSKLSGWLNADAPCQVETRRHAGEARCGPRETSGRGVAAPLAAFPGRGGGRACA